MHVLMQRARLVCRQVGVVGVDQDGIVLGQGGRGEGIEAIRVRQVNPALGEDRSDVARPAGRLMVAVIAKEEDV